MMKSCRTRRKRSRSIKRSYKASTGVGADGLHPKLPRDLSKESCEKMGILLVKVELCGRWSRQASALLFFLIPKNDTSETPNALLPTLIRWCGGRYQWRAHMSRHLRRMSLGRGSQTTQQNINSESQTTQPAKACSLVDLRPQINTTERFPDRLWCAWLFQPQPSICFPFNCVHVATDGSYRRHDRAPVQLFTLAICT